MRCGHLNLRNNPPSGHTDLFGPINRILRIESLADNTLDSLDSAAFRGFIYKESLYSRTKEVDVSNANRLFAGDRSIRVLFLRRNHNEICIHRCTGHFGGICSPSFEVTIDLAGIGSWDTLGAPDNIVLQNLCPQAAS